MVNASALKAALMADDEIRRRLRFDTTSDLMYYDGELLSGPLRAAILIDIQARLHIQTKISILNQVLDALEREPQFHFNPITEWLESLSWDGEPRLATLFANYFNSGMNVSYMTAVGQNFFVGLVARAYQPGCKMDTMLILEGHQGIGKTRALRAIGGKWYREHKAADLASKDMMQSMKGCWVYDINELRGFSTTDRRIVKSLLSSQEDFFRLPYRPDAAAHKRTCCIVGATNDDLYLNDETGNRRFWPIACGYKVEVEMIERDRDQLFAEAVALYKSGQNWWTMPDDLHNEIVMARAFISPYFERVYGFIGNGGWLPRYCVGETTRWGTAQIYAFMPVPELHEFLGIRPAHQRDKFARDADKCMTALGFDRVRIQYKAAYGGDNPSYFAVYRKHMGMMGTVSLIPEPKTEPPILKIVPIKGVA